VPRCRKAAPPSPPGSLNSVTDAVRSGQPETRPRQDGREPRHPARNPSGQSRDNRRQQGSHLNRDHEQDTVEAHEAPLRFPGVDCSGGFRTEFHGSVLPWPIEALTESARQSAEHARTFTYPATIWQYGGMVKVTFTLDDETVARLRKIAQRTRKPQSLVVREAVAEYAARGERLTEDERARALKAYDALAPGVGRRPPAEIARELRELRTARRSAGRRTVAR